MNDSEKKALLVAQLARLDDLIKLNEDGDLMINTTLTTRLLTSLRTDLQKLTDSF